MPDTITLKDNRTGKDYNLPVTKDTIRAMDLRQIKTSADDFGLMTYDPGYGNTAHCKSTITFIDGDKGILRYRGYPIEELAERRSFTEIAHLLMVGELPDAAEREAFGREVDAHNLLHDQVMSFFRGFRRDAHPMAVMVGVVGALSAFYQEHQDYNDPAQRWKAAIRLFAKMPTIAANSYTYSIGRPLRYPDNTLDYASNFLQMLFGKPSESYRVDPVLARALDRILLLHADHEQNASTSTVRMAASSGANPFACIASGIATLWGPAHGGANEAVLGRRENDGHPGQSPDCRPGYAPQRHKCDHTRAASVRRGAR